MWLEVKNYQLMYRTHLNKGSIYLIFADNTNVNIKLDSASELMAMADMLRNEKPVYYNSESKNLVTGWEPVGEEEYKESPFTINPG
ncbi:MAG: hypothetical protein IPP06_14780 [Saprospiraceae bacterium]|nr:hypothetical protein [Candidatus Vicinibacter affinis]MBK8641833.1 hypothetical protein [Candidatus Vicinibacter affinis]MBK9962541.1 hypothetical protein [Candidatus Vicinibacter affinis]